MAMTNAERQARWKAKKLDEWARRGAALEAILAQLGDSEKGAARKIIAIVRRGLEDHQA